MFFIYLIFGILILGAGFIVCKLGLETGDRINTVSICGAIMMVIGALLFVRAFIPV
jgi:hypothetical protein